MTTTLVTAFFDINRENKGDGRSISEYLRWIKKTLQINCNLVIITEKKFIQFMKDNRPSEYNTHIKEETLEDASYYKYLPKIEQILGSDYYKKNIAYPGRVECILPEYNIIQYSKFGWLEKIIKENPFNSEYFFWIDAGISRFFLDVDVSIKYPGQKLIHDANNKFIIQCRKDLNTFNIDDNFIWGAHDLLKGGMFGGKYDIILKVGEKVKEVFNNDMLKKNNVNNEQLALALAYNKNRELFYIVDDFPNIYLILFKKLSE
jgi:hypothetical protein